MGPAARFRLPSFTLRSWILIALVGLTLAAASVLGALAYEASRDIIVRQAMSLAGVTADARRAELVRRLGYFQEQARDFLNTLPNSCSELDRQAPSTRCVQRALEAFRATVGADGATLLRHGATDVATGTAPAPIPLRAGQLAAVRRRTDGGVSFVTTVAGTPLDLGLALEFSPAAIQPVFADRSGLGERGESFLADDRGAFLTMPLHHAASGVRHRITALPMQACLAGRDGELTAKDYRGEEVLQGFRYVRELGGGCVMAHINQAEAFAPARRLGQRLLIGAVLFMGIGLILSFVLTSRILQPLQQLDASVRALREGRFDTPVATTGPSELRALAQGFASMAGTLRDSHALLDSARSDAERQRDLARLELAERERAERALRESEVRFRSLVDQSPLSVQIFAPDGRTIRVNKAWERLWGVTLADIPGYNVLQDAQLEEKGILPYIRRAFAGQAVAIPAIMYDPEATIPDVTHNPQPKRWVAAFMYPVKDHSGEIREVVLIHEDISDRIQAETERDSLLEREQQARADAEAANRAKDEFLATLSHELRTPLNAVLGWLSMLRAGVLDEARRARALDSIERNAHAQARIIEDLLDVSRIITGKLEFHFAPVEVGPLVDAAVDAVRPAAHAKEIRLTSLHEDAAIVTGDAGRLQQAVWNLVSNAVKFTPPDGAVTVLVRRSGAQAEVTVSDTGEGFAASFLPHLFERFRQSDSSATRAHGGLGLGLAIVRHIVELHGGTVRADSPGPGRGATFIIRLPVRAAEAKGQTPSFAALDP